MDRRRFFGSIASLAVGIFSFPAVKHAEASDTYTFTRGQRYSDSVMLELDRIWTSNGSDAMPRTVRMHTVAYNSLVKEFNFRESLDMPTAVTHLDSTFGMLRIESDPSIKPGTFVLRS